MSKKGSVNYTRDNLFKITNMVRESGQPYTITKNGTPVATIISTDKYNKLYQAFEEIFDNKDEQDDIDVIDVLYNRSTNNVSASHLTDSEMSKIAKDEHAENEYKKTKK